jgi:dienelactone hydrolase
MPGFFVTGNLYRPKGPGGPFPAVLCAHGHWKDARFIIRADAEMKKELESGGERLAESGRSMFQSIGVQLARMGIVAFVYDMLGNSDSQQISAEIAHGFKKQRPEMNTRENWGLFSPQAETHAQSIMGLQTWNSIRALDFLTSLPDVDGKRLACTGASGGGTQTMILAAVDPRLAVECPAVMVSTAMQGGCTCENASLLRVGTGNIEFAALFAPKPLGMTAANDWTKEMETKGFPELKQHYAMMGAPENVALWAHINFPHNYNIVTREHIYAWFNEHFHLGLDSDRLKEREFSLLQKSDLTVWDDAHPAPPGGDDFERKLLRWWHDDAQSHLKKFENVARPAWRALIGWPGYRASKFEHWREITCAGQGKNYRALIYTTRAEDGGFDLPQITVDPEKSFSGLTVLWLDERGKAGLFTASDELRPEVARLLDAGVRIVGIDLIGQGEFLADGTAITQTRRTHAFTSRKSSPAAPSSRSMAPARSPRLRSRSSRKPMPRRSTRLRFASATCSIFSPRISFPRLRSMAICPAPSRWPRRARFISSAKVRCRRSWQRHTGWFPRASPWPPPARPFPRRSIGFFPQSHIDDAGP